MQHSGSQNGHEAGWGAMIAGGLAAGLQAPRVLSAPAESATRDPGASLAAANDADALTVLTADAILTSEFPPPRWAVPNLLPVGLTILAGAPKLGKSWLGLQIAQAVAAGGMVLGERVEAGPVLYLALEDSPRRLKERMTRQGWARRLPADFMPIGIFGSQIRDLNAGGAERLARQIERGGYRLVVVDTLSRAIHGDQLDVTVMTRGLTPLQEMAHVENCAVLLIDHHRKVGGEAPDAIADILGSTAKGAMVDTAWGLYRERGKAGARLAITGRELEERTLDLKIDWLTGCWQCASEPGAVALTDNRKELVDAIRARGRARVSELVAATGRNKGSIHRDLEELARAGQVGKEETERGTIYFIPDGGSDAADAPDAPELISGTC